MDERMKALLDLLEKEGLSLPKEFIPNLLAFEARLLETNQVMNLTAITEPWEMMKKQMLPAAHF